MSFASCRECGATLTPAHKIKYTILPQTPKYAAVLLKCSACGTTVKMAVETAVWEQHVEKQKYSLDNYKDMLEEWSALWNETEIPERLYEVWSKSPPRIEATRGFCDCLQCKRKWYAQI